MKLLPFQREFIKAVENPKYDTVAISGPRTLGKTFIAAQVLIRCMTPGDSLHQPGKEYILGAASLEQARLTYSFICSAVTGAVMRWSPFVARDSESRNTLGLAKYLRAVKSERGSLLAPTPGDSAAGAYSPDSHCATGDSAANLAPCSIRPSW